jgi:hypothetical protein
MNGIRWFGRSTILVAEPLGTGRVPEQKRD